MTKLEKVLYTARAHTTGGRDGGASHRSDLAEQLWRLSEKMTGVTFSG